MSSVQFSGGRPDPQDLKRAAKEAQGSGRFAGLVMLALPVIVAAAILIFFLILHR